MKLLITTLTFIFITSMANAKDTIYDCIELKWILKVEEPLIGKKKLLIREEGSWIQMCNNDNDIVLKDSFKCFNQDKNDNDNFFVLDEAFDKLIVYKKDGGQKQYSCFPQS